MKQAAQRFSDNAFVRGPSYLFLPMLAIAVSALEGYELKDELGGYTQDGLVNWICSGVVVLFLAAWALRLAYKLLSKTHGFPSWSRRGSRAPVHWRSGAGS